MIGRRRGGRRDIDEESGKREENVIEKIGERERDRGKI